jgi:hypothetical protein
LLWQFGTDVCSELAGGGLYTSQKQEKDSSSSDSAPDFNKIKSELYKKFLAANQNIEELQKRSLDDRTGRVFKELARERDFYYKVLKLINDTTALEKKFEIESNTDEQGDDLITRWHRIEQEDAKREKKKSLMLEKKYEGFDSNKKQSMIYRSLVKISLTDYRAFIGIMLSAAFILAIFTRNVDGIAALGPLAGSATTYYFHVKAMEQEY